MQDDDLKDVDADIEPEDIDDTDDDLLGIKPKKDLIDEDVESVEDLEEEEGLDVDDPFDDVYDK